MEENGFKESPEEPKISGEARERMEKNRQEALKRLQTKRKLAQYDLDSSPQVTPKRPAVIAPAPPSQFMKDTLNVASEGSIVRVQGTKLIDTGGGFLLEEKDLVEPENEVASKPVAQQFPAPIIPTDAPNCLECKNEFQESYLLRTYEHVVCDSCK